jgi:hypothetical protein
MSFGLLYNNGIDWGVNDFTPSIYFLVSSGFPDDLNSKFAAYPKYKVVKSYYGESPPLNKMYVCKNKVLGLDSLVFHTREDFYSYMKQFEGFTIPEPVQKVESAPEPELQWKNGEEWKALGAPEIYEKMKVKVDSIQKEIDKKQKKENKKKVRENPKNAAVDKTLTLYINNTTKVQEGNKWYVKFDVSASSNDPNTYLAETHMPMLYDKSIFGNLTLNKITVTISNNFNVPGNNYTSVLFADNDYISINFGDNPFFPNPAATKVKLSTTPVPLLHIKIELLGNVAVNPASCVYFSVSELNNVSKYTLSSNASTSYYYNKTYYINNYTPLSITSLSHTSRIAGVDDVLTIYGSGFGTNKGTVYFKAADDGGQTYLKGLDNQYIDIGSWSNTQINVKVPSLVYSGYSNGNSSGGAGSGEIKIKTAQGDSCESVSSLHIPYSIMNGRPFTTAKIRRVYLARYECNPDFTFTLHNEFNTTAHADKRRIIETALRHWSDLTGMLLVLEKDVSGNLVYTSQTNNPIKNIIQFKTEGEPETYNAVGCLTYPDTLLYRSSGSNIYFPRTLPSGFSWNYDTAGVVDIGQWSFYQACMHELGHILQTGHVNDPEQLMYYTMKDNHSIINLKSSDMAVSAVKANIAASKLQNWRSGVTGYYPAGALHAKFTTAKSCYGANNGSITTTVTGGVPPYTYTWKKNGVLYSNNQNLNNLAPGVYVLELRDSQDPYYNKCIKAYTVTVASPSGANPLTLTITKIPANPPTPELYKATVSGGVLPYTYKWSVSQKPAQAINGRSSEKSLCSLPIEYVNSRSL